MKKFFEMSFSLSLIMGAIAVLLCFAGANYFLLLFISLIAGFLGFMLCCANIVFTQKFDLPQRPGFMLILSLFLNSVPLIYMMTQIIQHSGHK